MINHIGKKRKFLLKNLYRLYKIYREIEIKSNQEIFKIKINIIKKGVNQMNKIYYIKN